MASENIAVVSIKDALLSNDIQNLLQTFQKCKTVEEGDNIKRERLLSREQAKLKRHAIPIIHAAARLEPA